MIRFFLTLSLAASFLPLPAYAVPTEEEKILAEVMKPQPGPRPADSAPSQVAASGGGLWSLELEMAENRYNLNKNRSTRGKLIAAYEKAINSVCLKDVIKTLEYTTSQDPRCQAYVTKMLQHVPGDPAALCARDGIDSNTCIAAYAQQVVDAFDPIGQASLLDLEGDIVKKRLEAESKVWQNLDTKLGELVTKSTPQTVNNPEVSKVLRKLLTITCRYSGENYAPDEKAAPIKSGAGFLLDDDKRLESTIRGRTHRNKSSLESAEYKAGEALPGNRPGARPDIKPGRPAVVEEPPEDVAALVYKRTRYIPAACMGYIDRSRKAGITDWSLTCYRDGFLTPQCVRALRNEKNKPKTPRSTGGQPPAGNGAGAPSGKESSSQGFSTF